jgi:hypothetical protein
MQGQMGQSRLSGTLMSSNNMSNFTLYGSSVKSSNSNNFKIENGGMVSSSSRSRSKARPQTAHVMSSSRSTYSNTSATFHKNVKQQQKLNRMLHSNSSNSNNNNNNSNEGGKQTRRSTRPQTAGSTRSQRNEVTATRNTENRGQTPTKLARPQTAGSQRGNTKKYNERPQASARPQTAKSSRRPQTANSLSSSRKRDPLGQSNKEIMKQARPQSAYLIKTGAYKDSSGSARSQQMKKKIMNKSADLNTRLMLDHWTDVEGRVGYVTEKGGKQHRNNNKSPSRKKNMLDIRLGNVPPPPGSNGPTMEFMKTRGMQPHEFTYESNNDNTIARASYQKKIHGGSKSRSRRRRSKKRSKRGGGGGFSWTGVYNTKYNTDYNLEGTMKNKYIYNPW